MHTSLEQEDTVFDKEQYITKIRDLEEELRKCKTKLLLPYGAKNDNIETPNELLDGIYNAIGKFYDPCILNCPENNLINEWGMVSFVNPPFSNIEMFLQKGILESQKGKYALFLIPFRGNKHYWKLIWDNCASFSFFWEGVRFKGFEHSYPESLVLIEFGDPKLVTKNKLHFCMGKYNLIGFVNK